MRRLSAAIIVRDESRFIEGCLQSLAGCVDEVVLVDTGSRDDTIEKARRFPISLYRFEWCDDFSAARNFALDRATGEWILYIDADERFEVADPAVLREVLADRRKVAWRLRFHPRIDWTPYAELRLFRNNPRIRFRNRIHERVHDSVAEVMASDGLETGDCMLALQHAGYEDDQSRKNPRNIPMLQERLKHHPDHLYAWWHLGHCLQLAGDLDGAVAAWSQGVTVARRVPPASRLISDCHSAIALMELQRKRGLDVSPLLQECLELYPEHLSLHWIKADVALDRGETGTAGPILESLAAIDPDSFFDSRVAYDKAIFRYLANEALALCRFREGRYNEAAQLYRLVAEHSPNRQACEIKARLAELRAA
jgi:tetratricopeptide (TPR) repeat protein